MHRSKLFPAILATLAVALAAGQSYAQTLNTLGSFNGTNGAHPYGDLALSADGSTLYGTTFGGGGPSNLPGTVFSVPVTGGTPTVLASLGNSLPEAGVTLSGLTLYGTTVDGGASGYGQVFSLPVAGGTPTVLASFNGADGRGPEAGLTLGGSTFYGVTQLGGANNEGVVFSLPVAGGTPTVLASFIGTSGEQPYAGLTLSADGSTLYGTTLYGGANGYGEVFSLPVGGGTPTVLASFNGANGNEPAATLTLIDSTLYGTTLNGGAYGDGTVFSLPIAGGTPTVLASFNGVDGESPQAGLTLIGATLYGATYFGGTSGGGAIFSLPVTGGTPAALVSFNNGPYSTSPSSGLIPSANGSTLYGATEQGGANLDGTVFALVLTPEPSSLVLFGLGALGLGALATRRRHVAG